MTPELPMKFRHFTIGSEVTLTAYADGETRFPAVRHGVVSKLQVWKTQLVKKCDKPQLVSWIPLVIGVALLRDQMPVFILVAHLLTEPYLIDTLWYLFSGHEGNVLRGRGIKDMK